MNAQYKMVVDEFRVNDEAGTIECDCVIPQMETRNNETDPPCAGDYDVTIHADKLKYYLCSGNGRIDVSYCLEDTYSETFEIWWENLSKVEQMGWIGEYINYKERRKERYTPPVEHTVADFKRATTNNLSEIIRKIRKAS